MTQSRSSPSGLAWFARLLGFGKESNRDEHEEEPPSVGPDDVRRLAAQVATQPYERILEESRRIAPILSEILRDVGRSVAAGSTTRDIADRLGKEAARRGLLPAMLGYNGFPAVAATSVNDEIVHGVPSSRALKDGDLLKVQFGVVSGVAFAAQGWTFPVGGASASDRLLLDVGPRALRAAVRAVSSRARIGDIAAAIQGEAEDAGLAVVRSFTGYGMGKSMIQRPQIPCAGRAGVGERIREGTILHLHVIIKHGTDDVVIGEDRWTAAADDGQRGAVFTTMVEVTADGHRLLGAFVDDEG